MNSLLPYDLIDTPTAIVETPMNSRFQHSIRHQAYLAAGTGASLSQPLRNRLLHYPALLGELLSEGVISQKDRNECFRHPPGNLNVMLTDFAQFGPAFETRLHAHLPTLEQLYWFLTRSGTKGSLSGKEYRSLLAKDPNYAFRLCPPEEQAAFVKRSRPEAEQRRASSPEWAYFYIATHETGLPLPGEILTAIRQSEEYSYLAARLLFGRNAHPALIAPLLSGLLSPRWAFHALRDGLTTEGEESRLIEIVHQAPEWGCEYYQQTSVSLSSLGQAYLEMVGASPSHPLLEELHAWYRGRVTQVLVPDSGSPPLKV